MVLLLCSFPVFIEVAPQIGDISILGVRLPWIMLGGIVYPLLIGAGWLFVRAADRNENEFVELVEH